MREFFFYIAHIFKIIIYANYIKARINYNIILPCMEETVCFHNFWNNVSYCGEIWFNNARKKIMRHKNYNEKYAIIILLFNKYIFFLLEKDSELSILRNLRKTNKKN
jgi:hypothetical protein